MGKRVQAEMKAFRLAEQRREEVIGQLKKCESYEDLSKVLKKYEEKKRKHFFVTSPRITEYHQQRISELDKEINQLKADLHKKYPAPSVPIKLEQTSPKLEQTLPENVTIPSEQALVKLVLTQEIQESLEKEQESKPAIEIIEINPESSQHTEVNDFSSHAEEEQNVNLVDQRIKREREAHLLQVTAQLRVLKSKQGELDTAYQENLSKGKMDKAEKYFKASQAAQNIYDDVTRLSEQYINDGNLEPFKAYGQELLSENNENVKILQEHRGWKSFLTNFAAFLFTAGLAQACYSLYKRELSWFKPATDTGKKVETLGESINSITVTV